LIYKSVSKTNSDAVISQNLSELVSELETESESIFTNVFPIDFNLPSAKEANELKHERWYLTQTTDGKPSYWNSNKFGLDSTLIHLGRYPMIYKFGDDVYAMFNNGNAFAAFRLANDGALHSKVTNRYPVLKNTKLNAEKLTKYSESNVEFTFTKQTQSIGETLWISAIASLLFLFLALYNVKKRHYLMYVTVGFILVVNLITFLISGEPFERFYFINSESFTQATDQIIVLKLLLHVSTVATLLFVSFRSIKLLGNIASTFILGSGLFFLSDFFVDLGRKLSRQSTISFDFEKLFGLCSYSFIGLALISIAFLILWTLCYQSKIGENLKERQTQISLLAALAFFVLFQVFDGHRNITSLVFPIIWILASLVLIASRLKPRTSIYIHFLITTLLTASIVYSGQRLREAAYAEELAASLIENKDVRAEQILQSFENELAQEFLIPEDYENFVYKKDVIESRIKHLYFSNYLEKYELKLLTFGPEGQNINQNNIYEYDDLDIVYNNNSKRTASAYFYQIDDPISVNGYIAKYENCDIEGHFGTTFILLQPRVVQSEFIYPEVFKNQKSKEITKLNDYSYGIYFNQRLISQKGSYPYKLNALPKLGDNSLFALGKIKHDKYQEANYEVVLSRSENRIRSWLSVFTFTLLILLPLSFLLSFLTGLLFSKEHPLARAFYPGASQYLSSRIQTSLTIILLAGLLLSVYIIISYIRANYNQNLEGQLLTKVKSISTRLQNKVDLDRKLQNDEQRTLMLNEESSTYNVDINLYDQNGRLLSSTKPYLTNNQILGNHMNPKAYSQLKLNKNSQLLIQEELEGSDYLSAYVPLFNGKNDVIGYLNTPFFAKNEQLNKQISNLVVNILNIYFLLLLGGVFIAYIISKQISKPLVLIREKIAKTELRGQNELIIYNRDDEIGQLVKQYNKMVMELEESADQMAESEREGAWREMAKQVAHEIKNPLTPMKLSVQHLQRAYSSGPSEKLDVLFTKTSKLLIDQINSLSNMASEFSNFAQMPEDKFEHFDVSAALASTVDLFKRSENAKIIATIDAEAAINADPEQIRRVFNNLIKNALQAIPEDRKGIINVTLRKRDKRITVAITDNGKGIPRENYKKVFVPNFSTKTSGMGLGLAMCKKIVETANGEISFNSEINVGTTFTVNLPINEKA
jgi:signal transduction histidine kinase